MSDPVQKTTDWVSVLRAGAQEARKHGGDSVMLLASEAEELAAELERVRTAWQPMSTAPRDGTEVLGYGRVGWDEGGGLGTSLPERRRVVMRWNGDDGSTEGDYWMLASSTPYNEVVGPVAWAPLLPEPANAK